MAAILTNLGKTIIANRLKGLGTEPKYVAWGEGAGTADITDVSLFDEAPEARVEGASSVVTVTTSDDTFQVIGTITSTAARAITNAGLFDDPMAGNLFVKGNFSTIHLDTNDSIQFTFKVTYA